MMSITKFPEQGRRELSYHLVDWDNPKGTHKEILNNASCLMRFLRHLKLGDCVRFQ